MDTRPTFMIDPHNYYEMEGGSLNIRYGWNPESSPSGCKTSEHAERNAIAYAARYGVSTDQSELYCTHGPCLDCSRAIINSGILRVFYQIPYRLDDGVKLLTKAGVEVVHMPA